MQTSSETITTTLLTFTHFLTQTIPDCAERSFANKFNVTTVNPHEELRTSLLSVDPHTREWIETMAQDDMRLYHYAEDVFWRRVAVMEYVSGREFADLPAEFRVRDLRTDGDASTEAHESMTDEA